MFCPRCGQENPDSAAHCSRCGNTMPSTGTVYGLGDEPVQPVQRVAIANNLVWAVLVALFCCLPTGIVAIVFAAQVDSKAAAGDITGAREASRNAAVWSWVSFGLGLFFGLAYVGLVIFSAALGH